MNCETAMSELIGYIEENLTGHIDYEHMARYLGCSVFHFQRMFAFITGTGVSEYIRRRRMTLAALDLKHTDCKIIDIAAQYGYQSQAAFARAFRQCHGLTPSMARREEGQIRIYPRMSLRVDLNGVEAIGFRVESTGSVRLFGLGDVALPVEQRFCLDFILEYGIRMVEEGVHGRINAAAGFSADSPFHLLHGVYFQPPGEGMRFMYGWESPEEGVSSAFTRVDAPGQKWVVFSYVGRHAEGLPKIWAYFYKVWCFNAGYTVGDDLVVEKETWLDERADRLLAEVWMPLKEKKQESLS